MPPFLKTRPALAWLALCLLLGGAASLASHTDANWDLQNYHLYAPFAALHGRLGRDYFVAGFQGYLNPTLDMPYFLLKLVLLRHHPMVVAFLAGLPFGALVFVTISIAHALLPDAPLLLIVPVAAIGLTGSTTLSEVGTTFGDLTVASVLLAGLWGGLRYDAMPVRAGVAAGLGLGLATGLKFTAAVFAPGMALVVLLAAWGGGVRGILRAGVAFGVAGAAGFLASWGWWGATLWRHFRNPFYPLLGRIFITPGSIATHPQDGRFFPHSLLEWLFFPAWWIEGWTYTASEESLRDPRFLLAGIALLAGVAVAARRGVPRRVLALWGFVACGYVAWLLVFSILRYAVAIEVLTGLVIWTGLALPSPPLGSPSRRMIVAVLLLVGCVAATKPMGWGRIDYDQTLIGQPVPSLPPHALVLVDGRPISFVMPYLPTRGRRFIRIDELPMVAPERTLVHALLAAGDPPWLLTNQPLHPKLAQWHLAIDPVGCRKIHTPVQSTIQLCPLKPSP